MYSPNKLDEMIGLEKIKEQIRISVAAALAEDRPMYHVLMHGPPGTGKTTMASIIANMMNANLEYTVGNGLRVKRTVMNLNYRDVVFIDEIHRVRLEEEEKMYAPMLDFVYIENEGLYGTTLEIPPFTLIGATTSVGSLSKPLVDRFPLQFEFPFYTLEELTQIVTQAAEKENIKATEEALIKLATASRDTPRLAVTLLNRANEYRQYNNLPKIALDTVESVFELLNIYEDGLTDLDKRYMELLVLADRPLGLNAIAASLMINQKTVREVIEPFLLRKRYMIITSSGRTLTTKGYSQYKKWHEKENGGSRNGY